MERGVCVCAGGDVLHLEVTPSGRSYDADVEFEVDLLQRGAGQ